MQTGDPSIFGALAARMRYLGARTGVLAENVANADTPNFVARDIAPPDGPIAPAPALRVSDPRHIGRAPSAQGSFRVETAPDDDAALNGNRVSLETQTMKLAATRMEYQLASNIYRKAVDMVRLAARGSR